MIAKKTTNNLFKRRIYSAFLDHRAARLSSLAWPEERFGASLPVDKVSYWSDRWSNFKNAWTTRVAQPNRYWRLVVLLVIVTVTLSFPFPRVNTENLPISSTDAIEQLAPPYQTVPLTEQDFEVTRNSLATPTQAVFNADKPATIKIYKEGFALTPETLPEKFNPDIPTTVENVEVVNPYNQNEGFKQFPEEVASGEQTINELHLVQGADFQPGVYTVRTTLINGEQTAVEEIEFAWGVLVVNPEKSIYLPGEQVNLGMAVLDKTGVTLCQADLKLTVTDPSGKITIFNTTDGTITRSYDCDVHSVTNIPDYAASFTADGVGTYQLELESTIKQGQEKTAVDQTYRIQDSFEVRTSVPYDVSRKDTPVRIYPVVDYPANFTIIANQDWGGPVTEVVPAEFHIYDISNGGTIKPVEGGLRQEIVWNADWQAGQTYTLSYKFDAPDISPVIYPLGPLVVGSFQESRQWQIASDATKTWDGGGTPSALWSTCANWDANTCPANTGDSVQFNGTSNNNSDWDALSGVTSVLGFTASSMSGSITLTKTPITVTGDFSHTSTGNVIFAGSASISFARQFTLTTSGTLTPNTSTVTMTTGGSNFNSAKSYYNLTINPASTGTINIVTNSPTVTGTLNIAAGDTMAIASGITVTHTGGTLTWGDASSTISGAGMLTFTSTSPGPGTGGVLSSIVRYDCTGVTIPTATFDARTYDGRVEVYSNSTATRQVAMPSGNFVLSGASSHLYIIAANSANLTVTGVTNAPTFTIGGDLDFTGAGAGGEILRTGAGAWSVAGNVDLRDGSLVAATNNTFTMTGVGKTIWPNGIGFYNLTFDPSSAGTITIDGGTSVVNTLTIASGDTVNFYDVNAYIDGAGTFVLDGTISGAGWLYYYDINSTFPTTGTVTCPVYFYLSTTNMTIPARTYGGDVFVQLEAAAYGATLGTGAGQTITINGYLNIDAYGAGDLTIDAATYDPTLVIGGGLDFTGGGAGTEIIIAGTCPWTVSGSADFTGGTYTTETGTCNGSGTGSKLVMGGTGTLTSDNETLYNLDINSAGTVTLAAATHTVAGSLLLGGAGTPTVTSSTISMTGSGKTIDGGAKTLNNLTLDGGGTTTLQNTNLTVSGTLNVTTSDTLSISSSKTLTHTGGTFTFPDTAIISGAGTLIFTSTSPGPGATGTLSSIVRYDATGANIASTTLDARTYGGAVIFYSSVAATRSITFPTGTFNFSSDVTVYSSLAQTAVLTVDASNGGASNPTINITGDLSFTKYGSATPAINTGTGTWTVSGSVNLTNGTYTTESTHTLIMNGTGTLTSDGETLNNLTLSGTITLATATHIVAGNLNLTGSTLTVTGSTISMGGTSKTVTSGGKSLNNFTVTGGSVSNVDAMDVNGDLTISGGTFSANSQALAIGGSFDNDAAFTSGTQTTTFDAGSGTKTIDGDGTGDEAFSTVVFNDGGGGATWQLTTLMTVSSDLTIIGGTFDFNGSNTLSVGGNFTNQDSITQNTGTLKMNGASGTKYIDTTEAVSSAASDFNNITFDDAGGPATYRTMYPLDLDGNLTITGGTLDMTGPTTWYLTNSGTNAVAGNWRMKSTNPAGSPDDTTYCADDTGWDISNRTCVLVPGEWGGTWGIQPTNITGTGWMLNSGIPITGTIAAGAWSTKITSIYTQGQFSYSTKRVNARLWKANADLSSPTALTNWVTTNIGAGTNDYTVNLGSLSAQILTNQVLYIEFAAYLTGQSDLGMVGPTTIAFRVNEGGTKQQLITPAFTPQVNLAGNFVNDDTFTHANGTVVMDATSGAPTIDADGTGAEAFYNLTFNDGGGSAAYELGTAMDVMNDLTITGGNFDANSNTLSIGGSWDNDDTFTSGTQSTTFYATSGTETIDADGTGTDAFSSVTFNDLGGSAIWQLTTPMDVNANLTITGGNLDANSNNLFIGGSWANNDTFTSGTQVTTFDAASGAKAIDAEGTGTSSFSSVWFESAGAASWTTTTAMDVNGTFDSLNGEFIQGADVNLNVAGNFTIANGATFTAASGTGKLILDGDLTLNDKNDTKQNLGDVEIGASPDTTDLASDMVTRSLTVKSADVFNTNGYEVDSNGNILIEGTLNATDDVETDETTINCAGNFTISSTATYTADQSTLIMDAGGTVTKTLITDGAFSLYNLIINDGGGANNLTVQVHDALDVDNDLTITNGTLDVVSGEDNAITVGGDWANADTFTPRGGTVTLDGTTSMTLVSGCADTDSCSGKTFNNLTINKTDGDDADDNVALTTNGINVGGLLTITDGELVQGTLNVRAEGASAVSVGASGKWTNISTGDLKLGGSFANAGTATFNSNNGTQCTNGTDDIVITSTSGGTQRAWTNSGTLVLYNVDATDMTDSSITAYTSTLSNTTWTVGFCGITVSGTVYQTSNEAGAFDCNEANLTLHVSVNGAANDDGSCTALNGTFSIPVTNPGAANIPVVLYIDSGAGQKATTITLSSAGSTDITGLSLIIDRVVLTQQNATAMSNAYLGTGDNGDAGIRYAVSGGNLTVEDGMELHVLAGKAFTPGGTVTTSVSSDGTDGVMDGDVHIPATATMTMGTNALSLGGDLTNAGTLSTTSTQTITSTATGIGFTFTAGSASLKNVTFNGLGGGWTTSGALTAVNLTLTDGALTIDGTTSVTTLLSVADGKTLTINSGKVLTTATSGAALTLNSTGTINGVGKLTYRSATAFPTGGTISCAVRFDLGYYTITQTMSARTYGGNVEIYSGTQEGSASVVTLGSGTVNVTGNLTLEAADADSVALSGFGTNPTVNITGDLDIANSPSNTETITTGTGIWTVSGNVDLTSGALSATSGNTLVMNGVGKTLTSNGQKIQNLTLSGTITLASALLWINGNLNLTGATLTPGTSVVEMTGTGNLIGAGKSLYDFWVNGAGNTVTVTSSVTVANTLTLGGDTDGDNDTLTIASGQTLTLSKTGTGAFTHNDSGVDTINGPGRLSYASSSGFPTTGTLANGLILRYNVSTNNMVSAIRTDYGTIEAYNDNSGNKTLTIGNGTHNLSGSVVAITDTLSGTGSVTIVNSNNATMNIGGSIGPCSGIGEGSKNISFGTSTWTVSTDVNLTGCGTITPSTSTIVMDGVGALTSNGKALTNFAVAGGVVYNEDAANIDGTFSVTDVGEFTQGDDVDLNIAHDFTLAAGTYFTPAAGTGKVIFDGDLTFTDGTSPQQDIGYVEIGASPDTTDLASNMVVKSLLVVATDVLNTHGYDIDAAGNVTINGTLNATNDVAGNTTLINCAGNFTINSTAAFTQADSTIIMDATGTVTKTLITDGAFSLYNLIINDGGGANNLTVQVHDALDVDNDLTITGGNLDVVSGEDNAINVGGSWNNDDTFTARNGTVTMDAIVGSPTIDADGTGTDAFYNLIFDDAANGITWRLDTIMDVNNDLTITGGNFNANSNNLNIGGSWDNNDTFTSGTQTTTFDAANTIETIDADSAGTDSFSTVVFNDVGNGATWQLTSAMDVNVDLTITGGTFDFNGSNTLSVAGNFINQDTIAQSTGTLKMDATTGTKYVDTSEGVSSAASDLYNITFDDGGGAGDATYQTKSPLDLGNNLTIANGTLDMAWPATWYLTSDTYNGAYGATWDLTNRRMKSIDPAGSADDASVCSDDSLGQTEYCVLLPGQTNAIWDARPTTMQEAGWMLNDGIPINGTIAAGTWTVKATTVVTNGDACTYKKKYIMARIWKANSDLSSPTAVTGWSSEVEIATGTNDYTISIGGVGAQTLSDQVLYVEFATHFNVQACGGSTATIVALRVNEGGAKQQINTPTFTPQINIAGNWDNNDTFTHGDGKVIFDAGSTGKTIEAGASPFYNVDINNATGGWTVQTDNMTVANDLNLIAGTSWTVANTKTLEVDGNYNQIITGANTTWTGSTLFFNGLGDIMRDINTKTHSGDTYATIRVGEADDIAMWNSSATAYTIDAGAETGCLYSKDHANADGDLYIYGECASQGNEYWSYDTDFDGADLSGSPRQVEVKLANAGGYFVAEGDALEIHGQNASANRTTITRQSAGFYSIGVYGAIDAQYYDFDYLSNLGLFIADTSTVTNLSDGSFDNAGEANSNYITVLLANTTLNLFNNVFDSPTDGTDTNVLNNIDGNGPNIKWSLFNFSGNKAGEDYDVDENGAFIGWIYGQSLSLSANTIDFGILNPSIVASGDHTIDVSTTANGGYSCYVVEDSELVHGTDDIDDVSGGAVVAGTEGFGVNCTGADCALSGDNAISTSPLTVADNNGPVTNSDTTMGYKASVSTTTVSGAYANEVTYTCSGNF